MAHEAGIIARWLEKVLTDDEPLTKEGFGEGRIWRRMVPSATPMPYIVFGMETGGSDVNAAGARAMATTRHGVRVYTDDSEPMDSGEPALNRIEEILDHVSAEWEGHLISVDGAGLVEGEEIVGGETVRYQGRIWQIFITKVEA